MGLPTQIPGGSANHIVGEHRSPLHAALTELTHLGGIHIGADQVGGIELIDHLRAGTHLDLLHRGVVVHIRQVVASKGLAVVELRGIPPVGDTLGLRGANGGGDVEVFGDVVGDNLLTTRLADRLRHRVDVLANLLVAPHNAGRLVQNFDGDDVRLLLIQSLCVAVAVVQKLGHITLLGTDGITIECQLRLGVVGSKAGEVLIAIGPPGGVAYGGREEHQNAPLRGTPDEVVEQVEVLVVEQCPLTGRVLPIAPEREAQGTETHTGEVLHIDVDHPLLELQRGGYLVGGTVIRGRGEAVVGTKDTHFGVVGRVANDPFTVLIDQLLG